MRGQAGFDRIAEQLSLTDDQKPKVKAILEDQRKEMGDLRQDTSLSREDKMAKAKNIREGTDVKLKAILTADQFQKWQAMQSQMRTRRPGGPPPGGAGGIPQPTAPPQQN